MEPERNRRRLINYWIYTTVQRRALAMSLSFICIVMMLTMAAMMLYQRSSLEGTETGAFYLHVALYAIFGATILIAAVANIWQSHKFCGAMVNFGNVFKALNAGDLTARVQLRKGDYLTGEAELFNEMASTLVNRIRMAEDQNRILVSALKKAAPQGVEIDPRDYANV